MKTRSFILICLLIAGSQGLLGQTHSHSNSTPFAFPDIPGYHTLVTDLHQHTVFSDGSVWPDIRVMEALREGVDVISLTEHLEYQPHAADIPHPDRNRSYNLALKEAADHDLLLVHGSEITRKAPMGHNNAVFISDANLLLAEDPETPFAEARKQGAFVFWNHPAWYAQQPQGNPVLSEFQQARIAAGELHGIEVINTTDYSEEALALALEHNLTIMGTSDIHGLIAWDYIEAGKHRPVTLVFAEDRTAESLKEALFAGRTVAVYNGLWVGKEAYLKPLLESSIRVTRSAYIPNTQILEVELENTSSSDLLLENAMGFTFYSSAPVFEIPAGGTYTLMIKTLDPLEQMELRLRALGAYTAPRVHPIATWEIHPE
ncbi:Sb-PDE family phosphodiesterase [Robiginitalea sp. M366]|uniref:Sb-PDE family phosphodiesterase n=1 Tax=Robiginitalea aestuariiviva TaxID=3036903 RepID=UPI00240D7BD5|nr:Sb-PDE family phosphodiesterase [Robiginitalea aestuariiviva]MDG1572193.1 Sb-PDE family phosphodiesterase [Robiginitalea aestuariiviva]